jgi:hypothetical protein
MFIAANTLAFFELDLAFMFSILNWFVSGNAFTINGKMIRSIAQPY